MDKITILIVDDHAVVRQGLRTFLELQADMAVVGEASNGLEAVEQARRLLPDLVLMDLVMPHLDGIEATRRIRALSPTTQVLVLTSFTEDDKVFPAIKAGALGYLLKDVTPGDLIKAVQAAHRGEVQLHPEIAKKLMSEFATRLDSSSPEALTERELEVLRLIARGLSNQEISETLVISLLSISSPRPQDVAPSCASSIGGSVCLITRKHLASPMATPPIFVILWTQVDRIN
jgi:NarL family two-component system response regulator LiaR